MSDITLTVKEQKAIKSLERLAKKWPISLQLFSWSGSLCILKKDSSGGDCYVAGISGIRNDGGDPDDVNQDAVIIYQ